jgi:hypothetical protein
MEADNHTEITIRPIGGADRAALVRLAERDSATVLGGAVLGAWVDGELVAARSLSTGRAVADPFRSTANVSRLLARRARQLRGGHRLPRGIFRKHAEAALPSSPPGAGGRALVLGR